MAAFGSMDSAESRVRAKVEDKTWIMGHSARTVAGAIAVRVQRPMSAANPGYGAWAEIVDDGQV